MITLPSASAKVKPTAILVSLMLTLALVWSLLIVSPAYAAIGWIGNMFPAGGSESTITSGSDFSIKIQVWKDGVTNFPGQGAGIIAQVYWSEVASFGGAWLNPTTTNMSYHGDVGNNDEYEGLLNLEPGLYEFTCRASDDGGSTWSWQGSGNGKIIVTNNGGGLCQGASPVDNNIYWAGLGHNSFDTAYRNPFGAVKTDQGTVDLYCRTCAGDVNTVRVRVWNDRTNTETYYDMARDHNATDATLGRVTFWKYSLPISTQPTIQYYVFQFINGADTDYYRDDDPKFAGGGWGQGESNQAAAYNNSYQITVYDKDFATPGWLRSAVIYQVFPERFRNGDAGIDPVNGGDWIYGQHVRKLAWTDDLCDPRGACPGEWSNQFYGGDLQGVIDELDYLQKLGVTTIYLNPIFQAPSNHLYDTQNYLQIDPYFGNLSTFQTLANEAASRGIRLMLDGVFNHVSSDSFYFDRYNRWDASGNLTSPGGPGTNDQTGSCESTASAWRSWFTFFSGTGKCYDGTPGNLTMNYTDWAGYDSLPKLNSNLAAVRHYIYAGGSGSVARYWINQGASGWRFDVGGDVDAGTATGDSNGYWAGFRTAVHTEDANAGMLGEEWGDASAWLVGDQWDSVMNYRFRSAVLSWMFDSCAGNGCTGGVKFEDNDSNDSSSSGPIQALSVSNFDKRLMSIREDYPPPAWYAMMNLMGSHDTNRVLFLLKKISNDDAAAAKNKFKFLGIFQFTYPGAPTLYYGDEAGLAPDGVWDATYSKWEDDPYNRAPYPWADAGRTPDTDLQAHFRKLAVLRSQYDVLREGDLTTLLTDDANKVYAYSRAIGTSRLAVVVLNRDVSASHTVSVSGLDAFNGKTLYDVMNCTGSPVTCASYNVSGGSIANISVSALNGAVLVEGPLPAYSVSLSAADDDIAANGSTAVVATVTDIGGQPAADGTTVNFTLSGGGNLSSGSANVSGGTGQASVTYQGPGSGKTVAAIAATAGSYAWARGQAAVFAGYSADTVVQAVEKLTIGPATTDHSGAGDVNLWVQKAGNGEPTLTLARYDKNPINGQADSNMTYYDVHLDNPANVNSLTVQFYYYDDTNESANQLYWHDGTTWAQVTGATLNTAGVGGYLEFTFTNASTPSLADLTGTPFGRGTGYPTAVTLVHLAVTPALGTESLGMIALVLILMAALPLGAFLLRRRQ